MYDLNELKNMLLMYLHASKQGRCEILESTLSYTNLLIRSIKVSEKPSKDELTVLFIQLAYHAQLLRYTQLIDDIEHQRPISFLQDYFNRLQSKKAQDPDFDLEKLSFESQGVDYVLADFFELTRFTLRLKKPLQDTPVEAYISFQNMQKILMEDNPNFNFSLDPHSLPEDAIFPLPIQGLGSLNNKAVDQIYINPEGEVRFAKSPLGYQLAGGGMFNASFNDPENLYKKILDEELEEKHPNLYKSTCFFNEPAISQSDFMSSLKEYICHGNDDFKFANYPQLAALKMALDDVCDHFQASNAEVLSRCIQLVDQALEAYADDSDIQQKLNSLRVGLQVETFSQSLLYEHALDFIKNHSKLTEIRQFLDTRPLAGTQTSLCAVMTGLSLEEWLQSQGAVEETAYADDLVGAKSESLTYLGAVSHFHNIRFSHLLIFMAAQLQAIDDNSYILARILDEHQLDFAQKHLSHETYEMIHHIQDEDKGSLIRGCCSMV